jgi:hypothetical protein
MKAWDVFVGFVVSALSVLLLSLAVDFFTKNPKVAKNFLISGLIFAVIMLILMICQGLQTLIIWGIRHYLDNGTVPEIVGRKHHIEDIDIYAEGFKPKKRERQKT